MGINSISIVVPTFNQKRDLEVAVTSLLQQDYPDFEVLVVDNNCTDGTGELVEGMARADARLRLLHEPEQGVTRARTRGCLEARGEFIAFLDHDEVAPPHWLTTLSRVQEETGADGVGGAYEPLWEGEPPWWLRNSMCFHETLSFMDFGSKPRAADWLLGGNAMYSREALEAVGHFGSWLSYTSKRSLVGGDDIVLGRRLRDAGFELWYTPEATVQHHVPRSRQRLSYIIRRAFWAGYTDVVLNREWKLSGKSACAIKRGPDAVLLGAAILPGILYGRLRDRLGLLPQVT